MNLRSHRDLRLDPREGGRRAGTDPGRRRRFV